MNKNYTTHLICAPDTAAPFRVAMFHVKPGQIVGRDHVLLTLEAQGQHWPVHAPDAGEVGGLMVAIGEEINAGDLLLMMEVEELPTGFLHVESEEAAPYHVNPPASHIQAQNPPATTLKINPAAAKLAARLGVDLSEIKANGLSGEIGEMEVEQHVREVMQRWQQLKQWINT